jgi:hypothetical protein
VADAPGSLRDEAFTACQVTGKFLRRVTLQDLVFATLDPIQHLHIRRIALAARFVANTEIKS